MTKSSSSSSDTDEEEKRKLQESVSGFVIESDKQADERKDKSKKKSLRPTLDDDFRKSVLDTTPEFRNFVAKKLESHIEENLKEKDFSKHLSDDRQKTVAEESDGIKLLLTSSVIMPDVDVEPVVVKTKKKKKRHTSTSSSDDDDDEEIERLRAAAVSSDFVKGISLNVNGVQTREEKSLQTPKKKKKKKKNVDEVD